MTTTNLLSTPTRYIYAQIEIASFGQNCCEKNYAKNSDE